MKNIYSLSYAEALQFADERGFKPTQVTNIFRDIYKSDARSFDEMKSTKSELVNELRQEYYFHLPEIITITKTPDTVKYLFSLEDGCMVETVLMKQEYGNSVCISTQCGCNMGCAFCCSGRLKKQRDLTPGEMTGQIIALKDNTGEKISNITIMGIGEPFDNFDAVGVFLDIATNDNALEVGSSHITLSICGIVPTIYYLADMLYTVGLAISLHAPNDELRSRLMPVNKKYPIADVIKAAKYYSEKKNRKVLIEYVMLKGVNDSAENAEELSRLLKGGRFSVNIIPYNPSSEDKFLRSEGQTIRAFYDILKKNGTAVTMRREFGSNVGAACGQLRSDRLKK